MLGLARSASPAQAGGWTFYATRRHHFGPRQLPPDRHDFNAVHVDRGAQSCPPPPAVRWLSRNPRDYC
jgi:hypothetical protein